MLALVLWPAIVQADALELMVTDYLENSAPEQRPLVARPLTFAKPKEVTIKTSDGRTLAYTSPRQV